MSSCKDCGAVLIERREWYAQTLEQRREAAAEGKSLLGGRGRCARCYRKARLSGVFNKEGIAVLPPNCKKCGCTHMRLVDWERLSRAERKAKRDAGFGIHAARGMCRRCYEQERTRRAASAGTYSEDDALTGGQWQFCQRRRIHVWVALQEAGK